MPLKKKIRIERRVPFGATLSCLQDINQILAKKRNAVKISEREDIRVMLTNIEPNI